MFLEPSSEASLGLSDVDLSTRAWYLVHNVRLLLDGERVFAKYISTVLAYLAVRSPNPGPLFVFQDGTPLSREQLIAHQRKALQQIGLDVANYSGHSFGIGAASTEARAGFSDSFIETRRRWQSIAFTTYIRTPVED